jgi:hypothetical protein
MANKTEDAPKVSAHDHIERTRAEASHGTYIPKPADDKPVAAPKPPEASHGTYTPKPADDKPVAAPAPDVFKPTKPVGVEAKSDAKPVEVKADK